MVSRKREEKDTDDQTAFGIPHSKDETALGMPHSVFGMPHPSTYEKPLGKYEMPHPAYDMRHAEYGMPSEKSDGEYEIPQGRDESDPTLPGS
jgi:hypothetical protein